jgi:hypothetical protein
MAEHRAQFGPDYSLVVNSTYRNAGNDGQDLGAVGVPSSPPAPPAEVCGDGKDNDGDGQIDEGCAPPPVEVCGDGKDNDGDGQIDEGCAPPPVEVCGDGKDNDGDGQIDEGCAPPPPDDTTGPVVTLWNVVQNPNYFKFKLKATDPSGIASVRVEFRGELVASSSTVPLDVSIPLRKLAPGAYELRITVTDQAGNSTVVSRTIMK